MHRPDDSHWITPTAFLEALAETESRLAVIRGRYRSLGSHAVLARGGIQIEPGADFLKLIKDGPRLFPDNPAKSEILGLLRGKAGKSSRGEKQKSAARIGELIPFLRIDGRFHVELRFHHLDYEAIWKLKADPLVDQKLTSPSRASIRVVLMPLAGFMAAAKGGRNDDGQRP